MSPSLTEMLRLPASPAIGLELARSGFALALCGRKSGDTRPIQQLALPSLFDESGMTMSSEGAGRLSEALSGFPRHLPIHVAIPNAVTRLLTLRSQERTRGRRHTEQLVRWHGERLGSPLNGMHLDFQWTGKQNGEHHLFAVAAAQGILDAVCSAAADRVVRLAAPSVIYLHRRSVGARPLLIVDLQEDAWALMVIDRTGNVRLARAAWRHADDGPQMLVDEARRFVNASGEQCEPRAVTCWCAPEEWDVLRQALEARFPAAASHMHNIAAQFWDDGRGAVAMMAACA